MDNNTKPVHFLLVEDDDDHAHLVTRAMNQQHVAVSIDRVADGEAAIRYLRREAPHDNAPRPNVIVLDLKLPKLDGHEVLREIKNDTDLARIPVVVLTTSDAESDRLAAYEARANSYLVKPLDFDRFQETVEQIERYWAVWNRPEVAA